MNFKTELQERTDFAEAVIEKYLPEEHGFSGRMAEAVNCKVVIPFHYDVWTNFKADPQEINMLYEYKKDVLQYKFKPFIWDVGGKFIYPNDKDKRQYHYRRGFEDCFTEEPNVPFRSIL